MEAARPVEPADGPRIGELRALARAELGSRRGGGVLVAERRARPAPAVVVGTIDGHVVGYGACRVDDLGGGQVLGVIDEIYVEPEARGVGVGEAMVGEMARWCSAAGCTGLDATALPGDRPTKGFFEGHGFTARLLVMHRRLDPTWGSGP